MSPRTLMALLREWATHNGSKRDVYWPTGEHVRLRMRLIKEEYDEVREELVKFLPNPTDGSRPHLAKELADLVYVVYGTAAELGIDLDEAVLRVHASNMTKEPGTDGGKAVKGAGYVPPYMDDFGPVEGSVEDAA